MRLLVCAALFAGCSIHHVSDELACTGPTDCAGGRSCVNGFCVTASSSECPGACDTCDVATRTCTIAAGDNNGRVTCPDGWNCTIACAGNGTCRGVDCTDAASCTILCSGRDACDEVDCGDGRCAVTCSGDQSCNRVDCNNSCACDVICSGPNSCDQATCTRNQCESGAGCASQQGGCSSC